MNLLAGKNVIVTGGARGQGRSHVIRCAAEGANVAVVDICRDIDGLPYPLATADDLAETVALAGEHGTRVLPYVVDVRDADRLEMTFADAAGEFGGLDGISVNAGVSGQYATVDATTDASWADVIAINLTGAFNSARAITPHLRQRGSGSIVFTASVAGVQGMANLGAYVPSKHGVLGLMRAMAVELASDRIRVNALLPTSVGTPMLLNDPTFKLMRPDLPSPELKDVLDVLTTIQLLPIPYVEERDVSSALVWLLSEEARYVTGVPLPIDGGALLR